MPERCIHEALLPRASHLEHHHTIAGVKEICSRNAKVACVPQSSVEIFNVPKGIYPSLTVPAHGSVLIPFVAATTDELSIIQAQCSLSKRFVDQDNDGT